MVHSMTGFASETGANGEFSWTIEIRSVNAKGLDVRVRAPERMIGFDQKIKAIFHKKLSRGSVSVSLRYEQARTSSGLSVDEVILDSYLAAATEIQSRADKAKLTLAVATPVDFMNLQGVIASGEAGSQLPDERDAMRTAEEALAAFIAMRASEGAALKAVLEGNLSDVSRLVADAAALAEARKEQVAETLRRNLKRVLDNSEGADADRVAQELAMLAVKADVTEEIDRLNAHVTAARTLLHDGGAIGRKLDFLMQEFNREANTLCSKSGSTELTRVGLDLKALIDQMREQVQNVE